MKILVTGSSGFIGKHVVRVARERGHEVSGVDLTLGISLSTHDVTPYDAVIHLAASIDIKESFEQPWKYIDNNINELRCLLNARRVVFASSAAVYGNYSPYGYTKRLGEALLPPNSVSLRLFNPFGPGENHFPETHIVPILLGNEITTLYRGGSQIRDFIDVRDVAEAFILAAESDIIGTYDLCNTPLTIREVAELVNRDYKLDDSPRDDGDTDVLIGNKEPLQKALNWVPEYDVRNELQHWRNWQEV